MASSFTLTTAPLAAWPSRPTAASTLAAPLEPTMTWAPSSIAAWATAKPMPDEPPMTTTRFPLRLMAAMAVFSLLSGSD